MTPLPLSPPHLPPPLLPLQVLFALNQTLLQHEGVRAGSLQGSYTTEDLITHYNCGDLNSIIFNHDTSQVSFQAASFSLEERRCGRWEVGGGVATELPKELIALFSLKGRVYSH